jgi:hypothetical protein
LFEGIRVNENAIPEGTGGSNISKKFLYFVADYSFYTTLKAGTHYPHVT